MAADHGTPPLFSRDGPVAQSVAGPARRDRGHQRDTGGMTGKVQAHKRHLQIMELYALGLTRKEIVRQLGLSMSTVQWHIKREEVRQARIRAALADWGREDHA